MMNFSLTKNLPIVSILERESSFFLWKTLDGVKNRDKVDIVDMQNVTFKPFTKTMTYAICVDLLVSRVALRRA